MSSGGAKPTPHSTIGSISPNAPNRHGLVDFEGALVCEDWSASYVDWNSGF